jgi:hypothetical protein
MKFGQHKNQQKSSPPASPYNSTSGLDRTAAAQPPSLSQSPSSTPVAPTAPVASAGADQFAESERTASANETKVKDQMEGAGGDRSQLETRTAETSPSKDTPPVAFPPKILEASVILSEPNTVAEQAARRAVEEVLAKQADEARYDVYDHSVTITLDDEDLRTYREQWQLKNADLSNKLTFSQYLVTRLKACRRHTSSRPVYVHDERRQYMESLFNETILDDRDLANKIDRHIRPIIESPDSPDGVLRIKPLDPAFTEMVIGWFPDMTPAEAIGDFMIEAAMQKAGLQ